MTDPYPNIRRRKRLGKDDRIKILEDIARVSNDETEQNADPVQPEKGTNQETLPPIDQTKTRLPRIIDPWSGLPSIEINQGVLEKNLVISASRDNPAYAAFDVLRTRLVQAMANNGWKRLAITSPTRGCGKTFVAVNLAIALSRYENSRTVLLDLDMRNPTLAQVLGVNATVNTSDFLRGALAAENYLLKMGQNLLNIGTNLAVGLNGSAEVFAAELAENPATADSLDRLEREINPDLIIFDMPPALSFDDVIAFRPHFDAVLIVTSGDRTKASDVREVMHRLGDECPLLGVILNRTEDSLSDIGWA